MHGIADTSTMGSLEKLIVQEAQESSGRKKRFLLDLGHGSITNFLIELFLRHIIFSRFVKNFILI